MKVHAYKTHTETSNGRLVELRGLCGETVFIPALPGENPKHTVARDRIRMFTTQPHKVTCKRCHNTNQFGLWALDATDF